MLEGLLEMLRKAKTFIESKLKAELNAAADSANAAMDAAFRSDAAKQNAEVLRQFAAHAEEAAERLKAAFEELQSKPQQEPSNNFLKMHKIPMRRRLPRRRHHKPGKYKKISGGSRGGRKRGRAQKEAE